MTITRTRRPLLGRLLARIDCWQLRLRIKASENDAEFHAREGRRCVAQSEIDRRHAQALTVELIRAERNT